MVKINSFIIACGGLEKIKAKFEEYALLKEEKRIFKGNLAEITVKIC